MAVKQKKKRKKSYKKKKRSFLPFVVLVLFLLAAAWLILLFTEVKSEKDVDGKEVTIEIPKGAGQKEIAGILKKNGLIGNEFAFYLKIREMSAGSQLKYGTFQLNTGYSLKTLIQKLVTEGAKKEGNWFTVPEGYTIEKIAKKLEEEGYCSADDFLEAVQQDNYHYWFLESIPEDADVTYRLQGFLFPDTYDLGETVTAEGVVRTMLDQFGVQYTKGMDAQAKAMGRTTYEIVTEASMIERETSFDAERGKIAGVIENRLAQNMRLQIDPTFLYPLTNGMYDKPSSTYEDTRTDSPYNTYTNYGFPVGPICSPGLPSIEAALNPESHSYLFYHTDTDKNDGSHIFTETYEEHLETQK